MNFRHIIFILVYFIVSISISSTSDEEVADLNKSESQIELPPINNVAKADNPPSVVVQASDDEIINSINTAASEQTESQPNITDDDKERHSEDAKTDDSKSDINKSENIQENLTIPVFSEWTQQQMQEAEKKLVELTGNSTESNKDIKNETLAKHQIVKMRQKNYASPDCGAKILANNPEAQSSSSVLSEKRDEYMLSPCTDRVWFVIELCDSIQAKRVELANFELFSSPLSSVSISVSNRFPTRDWTIAGHYDAKSERDVQVFELKDVTLFGKFVRVDLEYTNTEHYCPLSFFRIFGTSEIEAFEVDNEPENNVNHIEDDDEYTHGLHQKIDKSNDNLLNRAGAAVMSIVQKAAEVLVKSNGNGAKQNVSTKQFKENCMSLSHDILCEICSNDERSTLSNMITCKNSALKNLLENQVKEYLINTVTCNHILGFDLKSDSLETNKNFIASILPEKYIAAMCNIVASDQKALPLRIEDIAVITSKLISKKDEVSLKNVSKKESDEDVNCKHAIEDVQGKVLKNVNESLTNVTEIKDDEIEDTKNNSNSSPDDQNIFNHIERNIPYIEESEESTNSPTTLGNDNVVTSETVTEPSTIGQMEIKETPRDDDKKIEIPKIDSQPPKVIDVKSSKPTEPQQIAPTPDQTIEIKNTKEEFRASSSNAPESVFLRLSNRIKVLEKNMTLSTQYLEELSRRYKKQIEDLQQAYAKLQILYDNLNQSKKETEKKDVDDKRRLKDEVDEISKKTDFLEILLIAFIALLIVQMIFIIVLFKRLSILRDAFVMNDSCMLKNSENLDNNIEQVNGSEKTRTTSNGTKKKSKRVRKISAPNILSQRNGNANKSAEFVVTPTILNRTTSAPNKVNELQENITSADQAVALLEENDEILLSAFEDLKINDIGKVNDVEPKKIEDYDTTSTASVKTTDEPSVNGSVSFVRRLSSPTFLKLKKTTALKIKNGRSTAMNDKFMKKAKSESPPNFKSHNIQIIQKSSSFEEDALKLRKNNSFKKLFKKLF